MARLTTVVGVLLICLLCGGGLSYAQGPASTTDKPVITAPSASIAANLDPDHALPQTTEVRHGPVPSRHDVELREKLQDLAHLSDEQLSTELHKWPRYQKMSFGERAKFLQRIQDLRDHRKNVAANRAKELNLNLTPEQETAFEKSFWEKRTQAEKELWKEIEPRRKQLDEQINQELLKEFSAEANKPK